MLRYEALLNRFLFGSSLGLSLNKIKNKKLLFYMAITAVMQ